MNISYLIQQLKTSLDGQPWLGNSVNEVLDRVKDPNANNGGNSIGMILEHMVAWRKYTLEKIQGNERYQIEINSVQDWNKGKSYSLEAFSQIRNDLNTNQKDLLVALKDKSDDWLLLKLPGYDKYTFGQLLEGIIQHDIYHCGQIAILNQS